MAQLAEQSFVPSNGGSVGHLAVLGRRRDSVNGHVGEGVKTGPCLFLARDIHHGGELCIHSGASVCFFVHRTWYGPVSYGVIECRLVPDGPEKGCWGDKTRISTSRLPEYLIVAPNSWNDVE